MKGLLKIYGKYIASTWAIILLLAAANLVLFIWILADGTMEAGRLPASSMAVLEEEVFEKESTEPFRFTENGEEFLEKQQIRFLMILDEAGKVIFSWNCPADFQDSYTAGEIAAFSRWYLKDYPVRVWRGERGLLVAGNERGSLWKYSFELSMQFIENGGKYGMAFLVVNLLIILFIVSFFGYRFYLSLKPLSEGIEALAKNRKVKLQGKGVTAQLAEKLNRASDILEGQRTELDRRDTARTEWIAGVSHDIRTPLSLIMGYAEELEQKSGLTGEEQEKARIIKRQSLQIKQLIEDLNLTSKLAYRMQPLRMQKVYPAVLLRGLVAEVLNEGLEEAYELELVIEQELEGCFLEGDGMLLVRALRNLLNNSIRHNKEGCRIVLRGSRKEEKEEAFAVFSVWDDGRGIPDEVTCLLQEEPGNGEKGAEEKPHIMGLRIVKQIAFAHKGSFSIRENGHLTELVLPLCNIQIHKNEVADASSHNK